MFPDLLCTSTYRLNIISAVLRNLRMPRLHAAWGSSHRWAGIFFLRSSHLCDNEDCDSLL